MASDPAPSTPDAGVDGDPAEMAMALTAEAEALFAAKAFDDAVRAAAAATKLGLGLHRTWLILARACEAQGDLPSALGAYEEAAGAGADRGEISGGVGRVALRFGDFARAERLLKAHLSEMPSPQAVVQLADAQAGLMAFDRAHATLKGALEADPGQSLLWDALGRLLCAEGRPAQSTVFFEEALRLDPASASARAGLADALLLGSGEVERALSLSEGAVEAAQPRERPALADGHARRLLAAGHLAEGWTTLAAGMDLGDAAAVDIKAAAPRWTPDASPAGRLLLIGEDRLADQILLAHVVPSVVAEGRPVILAITKPLEVLARRSFREASVVPLLSRDRSGRRQLAAELDSPHLHGGKLVSAWRTLRSTLGAHRADAAGFAAPGPYLLVDDARVEHWRGWLASLGPGPKVGLRWRQPALDVTRGGDVPTLEAMQTPLSAPGLHLVSLQDGELMGETDWIQGALGLDIREPAHLDYDNLDDVAALACALDVVVGPPGVTTYLAAACGARTWFLTTPWHWALLGSDRYPWFPEAEVIFADDAGWGRAMDRLGEALSVLARG